MKNILYLVIFIISGSAVANDVSETIKGNFEGGNGIQYFKYDSFNIFDAVSYFSSSVGGVRHYSINVQGECNGLEIYKPYKSGNRIVLDGSCQGQGSQVHQYIYEWDKQYRDWCLRKEVSGERADRTSGSDEQLTTNKVKGCIPFGSAENQAK